MLIRLQYMFSCLSRDYHDDVLNPVTASSPSFRPEHARIWQDHMPACNHQLAMERAEDTLCTMDEDLTKLAYQQDTLKLAADLAMIGKLMEAEENTARSKHMANVLHMKQQ